MAEANKPGYWKKNNERQTKGLSEYIKSGGKDKIRLKNMKADIRYSSKMGNAKHKALEKVKEYVTAPSGRKFEITKSKSMGHQNIDYKHK